MLSGQFFQCYVNWSRTRIARFIENKEKHAIKERACLGWKLIGHDRPQI